MQKKIATGISFPEKLLKEIDRDRGDISRSRYITKFLEDKYFSTKELETYTKQKDILESNKNKLDLSELRPSDRSNSR